MLLCRTVECISSTNIWQWFKWRGPHLRILCSQLGCTNFLIGHAFDRLTRDTFLSETALEKLPKPLWPYRQIFPAALEVLLYTGTLFHHSTLQCKWNGTENSVTKYCAAILMFMLCCIVLSVPSSAYGVYVVDVSLLWTWLCSSHIRQTTSMVLA